MADLQNVKRQGTGQTWKEAYQDVDKTVASLRDLNEDFASFVADYNEFSDDRKQRFQDYLNSLDDVSLHWEEINDWVKKNSDTVDTYVGSLSNIRSIFQSIVSEIQSAHRQTAERLGVVRQFSKVANDSLLAVQQEGGLNNRVVQSLDRKVKAARLYYNAQLGQLGAQLDSAGNLISTEEELTRLQRIELARAKTLSTEIQHQENLAASGIRVDRYRLKTLRDELQLRETNAEILGKVTRDAVEGLEKQIERQEELYRIQRQGGIEAGKNAMPARRVTVASKFLSKFGLRDSAQALDRDYGRFVTDRVSATQRVELANERKETTARAYDRLKEDYNHKLENKSDATARLSKIAQKEKELEEVRFRYNQAWNTLKSVDYDSRAHRDRKQSTGRFVKRSITDKAFSESEKAAKEAKKLEQQIRDLKKAQADFTRSLASSAAAVQAAKLEAEGAAKEAEEAKTNENQVYERKFSLLEKIKGSIGDTSVLLAKIGALLGILMWRQLLKFDDEAVKTKRVIGQWADASALANTKFVTGTEVLETMRNLGEQFHINPVQVFSSEELGRIAQAQKLTGMSAEAAGNLGVQSKIIGTNTNKYRDSIAAGANQANRLNHSAATLSAVQNDVLNTSRAITLSYGKNVEGLAKAAGSAAALGMNLQQVEDISKNLMNFESSIEAEMQAQLLTGMQLNLAKAREYALNNDLNGVAQEISRQGMDAAKFSHMNYIQQENMAKALGMSREQMSKMLIMQEINRGLTAEQVAAMTGMKRQDVEALSAQEKWQTMKQRFLESLVPLLEPVLQLTTDILIPVTRFVLGPITWLAGLISRIGNLVGENNVVVRGIVGLLTVAISYIAVKAIRGVNVLGKAFGGIVELSKKIGTSIASWVTSIRKAEGAGGRLKTVFTGLKFNKKQHSPEVLERARNIRNLRRGGGGSISPLPAGTTEVSRIGKVFSSLGKNIGKIAVGAIAMGIMSLALIGIAKALQMLRGVEWKQFGIMAASIGLLAGTMIALGAVMMSGVGAALLGGGMLALGMLAVGMIAVGAALDSLGKGFRSLPAGVELTSISGGIRAIAGSVGELAVKLKDLQPKKLRALGRAFKNLRGAGIQIQTPVQETEEAVRQVSKAPENAGESKEIKRETIEAAAQNITIKQAQVQASAQQISVEQKATDLSKIEQKIDRVIKAVVESRPDWNWLEFNRAYSTNS